MNRAEKLARSLDRVQQRKPWLSFPIAVWKKFGDDQAGNLAALIAYYAFASLFPLLLVFVTVLDLVLRTHTSLRAHVLNSTFSHFPVVGPQLQQDVVKHVDSLHETSPALAVGLILAFLAARGIAGAAQNALNTVWAVPYSRRPGFPWNQLRSLGLIVAVGLGEIITSLLSGMAAGAGQLTAHMGAIAVSLVLNIGLFWLGFRLATATEVKTGELFPAAVLAGPAWQVLQFAGTYIVRHQVAHSGAVYGVFALVLGLLAWLYLQAQITLYAVEAAVVRARKLWPRSLVPPPLTQPDVRAYTMYATAAQRRLDEQIKVATQAGDGAEPGH
jgi:YihY family inner membrane protein